MLNSSIGLFIQKFPFHNLKLEGLLNTSSGPLIQDPPAAEVGHSSIILDPVALWKVEALNPEFFLVVQTLRLLYSESMSLGSQKIRNNRKSEV